ncbi:MAG: GDSL-type esterase/lipase family protein [bacterium]|nr:GDSL-type esterase/lipase family protein [bacterium]
MTRTLVVLGDGIAGGYGDSRRSGWLGRVLARSATPEPDFVAVLPVPEETTTQLASRWSAESSLRWGVSEERRLLIAPGAWDAAAGISLARTRLNLANILDDAITQRLSVFFVGPAPTLRGDDSAVAALDGACYDVCERRGIPYAALYTSLKADERWAADLGAGDGVHPSQVGHGMIAHVVMAQGWHAWFGSAEA